MASTRSDQQPFLRLQTKVNRPAVAANLVNRPRLLTRLVETPNKRLTLIVAPAGFGKSTLLCQWLEQAPFPAAWLSLDGGDNDLLIFLDYLITAVQTVFPQACSNTQSLLSAAQMPPLITCLPL